MICQPEARGNVQRDPVAAAGAEAGEATCKARATLVEVGVGPRLAVQGLDRDALGRRLDRRWISSYRLVML
ncbi:MAG: hypothetical protein ACREH3_14405, partial [Geminicoccales bacterium]